MRKYARYKGQEDKELFIQVEVKGINVAIPVSGDDYPHSAKHHSRPVFASRGKGIFQLIMNLFRTVPKMDKHDDEHDATPPLNKAA